MVQHPAQASASGDPIVTQFPVRSDLGTIYLFNDVIYAGTYEDFFLVYCKVPVLYVSYFRITPSAVIMGQKSFEDERCKGNEGR